MANLSEEITGPLAKYLGHILLGASYDSFEGDIVGTVFDDPHFYFGGEVHLRFNDAGNIFISWDQVAGEKPGFHRFTVSDTTLFRLEGRGCWSSDGFFPWSGIVGKPLRDARLYEFNRIPMVVELSFGTSSNIFVCISSRENIGDGDDIVIRSSENMIDLSDWELLWSGSAA